MTPPKDPPKRKFVKPKDQRRETVNLKKAIGKTVSQQRWLQRQLNDPYVQAAKDRGYLSRAAFKLIEIDEKYKILRPGLKVVDLGCAPGGWTQVCVEKLNAKENYNSKVVGMDLQEVDPPIDGATLLVGDFLEITMQEQLLSLLNGKVDVVLSDMAPSATGHNKTDHLRIMGLAESAYHFARQVLAPGGTFLCKVLQGGTEAELLKQLKQDFKKVTHVKPAASRKDSSEMFVIGIDFNH